MTPAWFDAEYFGQQKVLQMNRLNYEPVWLAERGQPEWTFELYSEYLNGYRDPAGRPVSAYENFLACNASNYGDHIQLDQINVSANRLFDVDYYLNSIVEWANGSGQYGTGDWTSETMLTHIFSDLKMSLWEHFFEFGMMNELNPSAEFDTHAYLAARVEAMNSESGGKEYTVADAIAALKANSENPIMDSYGYGAAHNIAIAPVFMEQPAESAAPDGSLPRPPLASSPTAAPQEPQTPVNPETPPANIETPPVETETPPADPETPPVDPETPPVETETPPADPETPPVEPETPPVDPENPSAGPIVVEQEKAGDIILDPIKSNGLDIIMTLNASGFIDAPLLDGRGGETGNVNFTVTDGEFYANKPTAIYGHDLDIDIYGACGYPKLELWASGAIQFTGAELERPNYIPNLPEFAQPARGGVADWVAVRSIGGGESNFELGNGKDIFELFDISVTCSPATLPMAADLHIDLGICSDQLQIGTLKVENGGLQTIHVDLGQDFNYEMITLGRVTEGKLILQLANYDENDEITSRYHDQPRQFADVASAQAALAGFGIEQAEIELGIWQDRAWDGGRLIRTDYANAVIIADESQYVFYGNCLLELLPMDVSQG